MTAHYEVADNLDHELRILDHELDHELRNPNHELRIPGCEILHHIKRAELIEMIEDNVAGGAGRSAATADGGRRLGRYRCSRASHEAA